MKKYGILLVGLVCVLGISSIMSGCNKKKEASETVEDTIQETETQTETETEEIVEEQVIGKETEMAYQLLITNNMGQNIVGIAIKGIADAEYPENMMKEAEVLAVGDTARLYYSLPVAEDEETTEDETKTGLSDEKLINELYTVQLTLEDETVVELTNFGFDDIDEAELCYEDEVGFIKYISKETGEEISTKEMELAQKTLNEEAQTEADAATNYVKPATSSTPATEAPVVEAPVVEAPVVEAPAVDQNVDNCLGDDVLINENANTN